MRFLIFLLLVAAGFPSKGQFQNVQIYKQENGHSAVGVPSVAINPRQPMNRVVASLPGNVYQSADGGKTWQLHALPGNLGNPQLVSDAKGKFFLFYLTGVDANEAVEETDFSSVVLVSSADAGGSWSPAEPVTVSPEARLTGEAVALDAKGNLYMTWTAVNSRDTACASRVFFVMSKNGKKWSDPVLLSKEPGGCLDDGTMTTGSTPTATFDGKVLALWGSDEKIFLDRSFNGGELWLSNDIPVADRKGGGQVTIPGHGQVECAPEFLTDLSKGPFRGSLYVVWADQRNGQEDTDIWLTRSHNFGDNWSSPVRINDDGPGHHQYVPSMAVDQTTGYIYLIYYDRRDGNGVETDLYLAFSTDGGVNFKNIRISESSFSSQPSDKVSIGTDITAHNGIVVPVWTRVDGGQTSIWTASINHEDLVKATTQKK